MQTLERAQAPELRRFCGRMLLHAPILPNRVAHHVGEIPETREFCCRTSLRVVGNACNILVLLGRVRGGIRGGTARAAAGHREVRPVVSRRGLASRAASSIQQSRTGLTE